MTIKSCKFIEAGVVFKDCRTAWDLFAGMNPERTWGKNNRSLVVPDVIRDFLSNCRDIPKNQFDLVRHRLDALENNVYVDLEN